MLTMSKCFSVSLSTNIRHKIWQYQYAKVIFNIFLIDRVGCLSVWFPLNTNSFNKMNMQTTSKFAGAAHAPLIIIYEYIYTFQYYISHHCLIKSLSRSALFSGSWWLWDWWTSLLSDRCRHRYVLAAWFVHPSAAKWLSSGDDTNGTYEKWW